MKKPTYLFPLFAYSGTKVFLAFVIVLISFCPSKLAAQCNGNSCAVCDISASITSISGGNILNGTSSIGGTMFGGDQVFSNEALVIEANSCGVIELTVELDFDWQQGNSINWIHGVSFEESGGWLASEGGLSSGANDWLFLNGITGACSGESFGPGYYFDDPGPSGSSYNGFNCNGFGTDIDGDPSDNFGVNCTTNCPNFSFELEWCPSGNGTFNERIAFFLTADGDTGGWWQSDGCIFNILFPITFESVGVQFPVDEYTICQGDCVTIDAGDGCDSYLWETGETTQTIEVCPTSTRGYFVEVSSGNGCFLEGTVPVIVEPCCSSTAGTITADASACPGQMINYDVTDFSATSEYTEVVFVTDDNGIILEILSSTAGQYTSSDCGNFALYSYNYLTSGAALVPSIGMDVSTIDCSANCCDLMMVPLSFEDVDPPTFPNGPMNISFNCIDDVPALDDVAWEDLCAGTGNAVGMETGSVDLCSGGSITRTWEATDDCGNIGTHTQTIDIMPPDEAVFIDPPANETIACDAIPSSYPDLAYSNNMVDGCMIEGTVPPSVVENIDDCGGTITITWEFRDICDRTIVHEQVLSLEPPQTAVFINPPDDYDLLCGDPDPIFDDLAYSNSLSLHCEIEGSVTPVIDENYDVCGGTITATWEYKDDCDRTITHVQVVTVEPAPIPVFIDAPDDTQMSCEDIANFVAQDLNFSNSSSGLCLIDDFVTPVVTDNSSSCGGNITILWEVMDPCDRLISHTQIITIDPAPQADFLSLPSDLQMSCEDFENYTLETLEYSNLSQGTCLIEGNVLGDLDIVIDPCGSTGTILYEFMDDCGRTISHVQNITVDPVDPPRFLNLPNDLTLNCDEVYNPEMLMYDNDALGVCQVIGSVDAIQAGTVDACGGTISYIWTYTDACFQTISHTQFVEFEPASEPDWVDPIDVLNLDCGEPLPPDLGMEYTNGESGVCEIAGIIDPTVDMNGSDLILTWSFINPCSGIELFHEITTIQSNPPDFDIEDFNTIICEESEFDLSSIEYVDLNTVANLTISYHDELPATSSNEISEFVYPFETTTYYIVGSNDSGCSDFIEVLIEVEIESVAGDDGAGEICIDEEFLNLYDYLSDDADFINGVFFQDSGPELSFFDAEIVNISTAEPGIYVFEYFVSHNLICLPTSAFIDIEILPQVEVAITNIYCSADFSSYIVEIANNGYDFTFNAGEFVENTSTSVIIGNIPIGTNLELMAVDPNTNCMGIAMVTPPNCDCPDVPIPTSEGPIVICEGDLVPALTVTVGTDLIANWYDTAAGGTQLLAGSTSYTPAVSTPGVYTYYVESESLVNAGCTSDTRVPVILEILSLPLYSNMQIPICDTDEDGIFEWDEALFQSFININPSENISYYNSMADAVAETNSLALPFNNQNPFTENIFAAIENNVGCITIIELALVVNPLPAIDASFGDESCADANNGTLNISSYDASSSYTLNGNPLTTATTVNLSPGDYELIQIDATTCSNNFNFVIQAGIETNIDSFNWNCSDNETNTDSSDDFYDIDFNLSNNQNNSGSYTITDENSNVVGTFNYGEQGSVQLSADELSHTYTFVDDDHGCMLTQTFGPLSPCSSSCVISESELTFECDDNGTGNDSADDTYQVSFIATAINSGALNSFNVAIDGVITYNFQYGELAMFGLPANGDIVTLTLSDSEDQACLLNVPVGPLTSCSDACVVSATASNIVCNDNETPFDDTDDVFFFDLLVSGNNVSDGFNIPSLSFSGEYDVTHTLGPFDINEEFPDVIVVDNVEEACLMELDIEIPSSCSETCTIESELSNVICNDSGTSDDGSDDVFFFDLTVFGSNQAGSFSIPALSFEGDYGESYNLGPFDIEGFNASVIIEDDLDSNCFQEVNINIPAPCSVACGINVSHSNVICDDNGTSTDNSDDVFFFDFIVTGDDLITGYSIESISFDGEYNENYTVGPFEISGFDPDLLILDNGDVNCFISLSIDVPNSCSEACSIDAMVMNTVCDDSGTGLDDSDDVFYFDLSISGDGNATGYNIEALSFDGSYNEVYNFGPFDISEEFPQLLVQDLDDVACSITIDVEIPATCSDECILNATPSNVICDSNGTDDDNSDDVYFFDLVVDGVNASGGYDISSISFDGEYGENYNLGPFEIANPVTTFLISDSENENCNVSFDIIPPNVCSDCNQTLSLNDPEALSCDNTTTSVEPIMSEDGEFFEWSGPDDFESNMETIIASVPGDYSVTVTFDNGCVLSASTEVMANGDTPIGLLGPDLILNCDILEVELDATASSYGNDATFEWLNEAGEIISTELTTTVSEPGFYYFEISDPNSGCNSVTQEIEVELIITDPSAAIFADPGNVLDCFVEIINLSTAEEPFVSYSWTLNNSETIESDQISVEEPLDIVLLALDTISGCYNESSFSITDLTDFPVIIIEDFGTLDCDVEEVCIDVSNSPFADILDFAWYDEFGNEVGENSPMFCSADGGNFIVELTDPNNNCVNDQMFTIEDVSDIPPISLPATLNFMLSEVNELTVDIGIPMDQVSEIIWSPSENLSCDDCVTTIIEDAMDGMVITVEVIATNGCSATASTTIQWNLSETIYVPTVMNTNSDIGNDHFTLFSSSGVVLIKEMNIFDRWGEKVFTAMDIPPNEPGLGWNGSFNGSQVVQGVYVYMFEIEYSNGDTEIIVGDITVIR